ncbi:MAG: DUF2520 domain-containing protein [Chloroflexi bacterium]|nr:MAG: DUF2520 domain-containing protein [Chloroflexota bacterium]
MIESVRVVGTGRAGGAIAARLKERGLAVSAGREAAGAPVDLVVLCVPDAAIPEAARTVPEGPWIAHVSGATTLGALDPHTRRFSVHPLQTLSTERGPEQLDGAWAAVTAETDEAAQAANWLAETLGLKPFPLADADRPLYHAAAVIAGNYLVTLYRTAAELFEQVGAPPEALVPLMQRTIENGFVLTGPIARGDWGTVESHLRTLEERAPEVAPLYRALAKATRP